MSASMSVTVEMSDITLVVRGTPDKHGFYDITFHGRLWAQPFLCERVEMRVSVLGPERRELLALYEIRDEKTLHGRSSTWRAAECLIANDWADLLDIIAEYERTGETVRSVLCDGPEFA